MKTEDIIKYALIAVGAYLVWEYVISPMMAGTGTGTSGLPSGVNAISTNAMSMADQIAYANYVISSGGTAAAVNAQLQVIANQFINCSTTGGTFGGPKFANNALTGTTCTGSGPATAQQAPQPVYNIPQPVYNIPPVTPSSGGQGTNPPTQQAPAPIPTAMYTMTDQPWAMQVAALNTQNIPLNLDQWDYYYNQVFSSAPISGNGVNSMIALLTKLGYDRTTPMTLPQWYYVFSMANGGMSGLGAIVYTPSNMGMGTLRGGFSGKRPNAFSGGSSGRKTSYVQ